jgi:hypothetical protein
MDFESLRQFEGQNVRLTLLNNFWYRAKILSVTENSVVFIEAKGYKVSVAPEQIVLIEEMRDG